MVQTALTRRIVVAPDAFKGSLSAVRVAEALIRGMAQTFPDAEYVAVPIADGGEGTVQVLVEATGGSIHPVTVEGPLGEPVQAFFGVLGDGVTAVVEMAAASGLPLVPPERRNPLVASSVGTGQLIRAALDAGCRKIILGLGGSATNDGGAGMATALGARLLDAQGRPIPRGGEGLAFLERIDVSAMDPRLAHTEIIAATDVDNPLAGPRGASRIFGPQKGATPEMVERLDAALAHYGRVLARELGVDVAERPGAGAAGGVGAGAMAFLGARVVSGVELVMETVGLAQKLEGAWLVITGEGRLDGQTARGKAPAGVARLAAQAGVPVIGVAGSLAPDAEDQLRPLGFAALLSVTDGPMDVETAMARAEELLEAAGRTLGALLRLGQRP